MMIPAIHTGFYKKGNGWSRASFMGPEGTKAQAGMENSGLGMDVPQPIGLSSDKNVSVGRVPPSVLSPVSHLPTISV